MSLDDLGGVNRTWQFTPQIAKYDLPPLKSSNFEQNFKRTQHHALLHKGLFCERPKKRMKAISSERCVGYCWCGTQWRCSTSLFPEGNTFPHIVIHCVLFGKNQNNSTYSFDSFLRTHFHHSKYIPFLKFSARN